MALLLTASRASPVIRAQPPTVDLGYTRYAGTHLISGVDQYLGISYAAPPLGELRWRAPAEPSRNDSFQDATKVRYPSHSIFHELSLDSTVPYALARLDSKHLHPLLRRARIAFTWMFTYLQVYTWVPNTLSGCTFPAVATPLTQMLVIMGLR